MLLEFRKMRLAGKLALLLSVAGVGMVGSPAEAAQEIRSGTGSTGAGRSYGGGAQAGTTAFEGQAVPAPSFYQPPLSYSTTRDPDPPRYVRNASKTGIDFLKSASWLDLGLDYRFRYEYRDDDIRRPLDGRDEPWLHRTRLYLGVKEALDPFRFAFEMQDARRYNSDYPYDNRDVNEFEIIRLYGELYFDKLLGVDAKGTPRPVSLRYGIHNFEFLDRRLIGNNQWRNTANTFQGFHGTLGQERNDWQLDLLAVQPRERALYTFDETVEQQWLYALIGHWRGWSEIVTIEPYYLGLHQSAYTRVDERTQERQVDNYGLRLYGKVGRTGLDYDASANFQFGYTGGLNHRAFGGTVEVGYSLPHAWKPRFSLFYGYASGDEDPNDGEDNRFERFFGFGRPWSANDYIVFENISTPKARVEITPLKDLRIDFGYSFYWLASDQDRFANADNVRDITGMSGSYVGHEFDIRARYSWREKTELAVGYAHFTPGEFVRKTIRKDDTDFFYVEISHRFF